MCSSSFDCLVCHPPDSVTLKLDLAPTHRHFSHFSPVPHTFTTTINFNDVIHIELLCSDVSHFYGQLGVTICVMFGLNIVRFFISKP